MKFPLSFIFRYRLGVCLLLLAGMAGGCYPDDFDKASWGPEPELTLSSPGVTLQPAGGTEQVSVTTNYGSWTAVVAEDGRAWCSVEQSGNILTIRAVANNQEKERETVISVTVGKAKPVTREIAVMQLGTAPRIVADSRTIAFNPEGGNNSVKVTTNLDSWSPTVSVGADWCSAVRKDNRLTVTAQPYSGKEMRQGLITLNGGDAASGSASATVTIIQMGTDPVLEIPAAEAFDPAGGKLTLQVITNQNDWEVTVPASASWCKAVRSNSGLTLSVDANKGKDGRSCELLVTAGDGLLKRNVMVVQAGTEPQLMLSASEVKFRSEGEMYTVTVFTNQEWKAVTDTKWCALLPGENTLTLYADKNTSATELRRGTVTVTAGNLTQTLTLVQAPEVTLVLSYDTLRIAADGGTKSVTVLTNQPQWKAEVPPAAAWCQAVVSGNQLLVTVDANHGGPREVVVEVSAGISGYARTTDLLVCQEGTVFRPDGEVNDWGKDTVHGADLEVLMQEREILIEFYYETNGDEWKENAGWKTGRPLAEWYGVTTDAEGFVTALNLADNNLSGRLSELPARLSRLQVLKLAHNRLTGVIPAAVWGLGCYVREDVALQQDADGQPVYLEEETIK